MNVTKQIAIGIFAALICCLGAAKAGALAYGNFSAGTLTVTMDTTVPRSAVVTGTSGGNVKLNGTDVNPPTLASAVTAINVTGSNNTDVIDLSGVSVTSGFTGIAAAGNTVAGGTGSDIMTGSQFNDTMTGVGGNDTFIMSGGADNLNGGGNNDTFFFTPPASGVTVTVNGGGNGPDVIRYDTYPLYNPLGNGYTVGTQIAGTIAGPGVGNIVYSVMDVVDIRPTYTATAVTGGTQLDVRLFNGDANFTVSANNVKVDGNDPAGGTVLASAVSSMTIAAADHINPVNVVNLSSVTTGSGFSNSYLAAASQAIQITLDSGADITSGSAFSDLINGDAGSDIIFCGPGNDVVNGGSENDTIFCEDGNDVANGGSELDLIYGDSGADTLYGGTQNDTLRGGTGDDTINGEDQYDLVYGDAGNDVLTGANGYDTIYGGDGDDTLNGGALADSVYGEAGNDLFVYLSGDGVDGLYGNDGDDTFNVQAPTAGILTIDGGEPTVAPGDVLNYDAMNNVVFDSGLAITGLIVKATNYTNIETKNLSNRNEGGLLTATPNPLNIYSDALSVTTGVVTIANTGVLSLNVTAASIANQSVPDAFAIHGGNITSTVTIPTSASIPITIDFTNNLGAGDALATAWLVIESDTGGVSGSTSTVNLIGGRNDNFVWATDVQGQWTTAGNWIPNGVPGAEDTAVIGSGLTTRSTLLVVDRLYPTRDSAVTSLALTGGALQIQGSNNFAVATNGKAECLQSGGSLSANQIQVGNGAGADGLYSLTGGQATSSNVGTIGWNGGKGNLALGAGTTFTITNAFHVGFTSGSVGAVTVNGGALIINPGTSSPVMDVGRNHGIGVVNVNSGAVTVKNSLYVARDMADSRGTVNLNGGSLSVGSSCYVSGNDTASLTGQGFINANAGSLTVANQAIIGQRGYGELNIDGANVALNGAGTTRQCIGGWDDVNVVGEGKVLLKSGALNIAGILALADEVGSTGTLIMQNGALSIGNNMAVGRLGVGAFEMSNGLLSVGADLNSASAGATGSGAIDISGGIVRISGALNPGTQGTGSCVIRGTADVRANRLVLGGTAATGIGSFAMSGGSLVVDSITTGALGAAGGWNWTGGTIGAATVSLPIPVTNAGGTLLVGGEGVRTTIFTPFTNYTQTDGTLDVAITSAGVADQLLLDSASATIAGTINVHLVDGALATGGSWDIVLATGSGSIVVSSVTVNLPGSAPSWTVTSDSTKVTVRYMKLAELVAPALVTFKDIVLASGETPSSKTFAITNIGDFPLQVTDMALSGDTTFTVIQPTTFPVTLTETGTGGASANVVVEFTNTTSGTYVATLDIINDTATTDVPVTLRAKVIDTIISASGIEAWTRY